MGQIHKIGDEYYIEFSARGLLYQQKAGKDLGQAEGLLRSIEEKIAKGELQTIVREIDLDIFFTEFLKYAKTQNHPITIRRLSATIEHFGAYIRTHQPDVKKLSQITPRIVEDYKLYGITMRAKDNRLVNPKVINLTLLLLREIFEYGIKIAFINGNPTLHVRLLDTASSIKPDLTHDQLSDMFDKIPQPYRLAFMLMRYSGLRPVEAINLTWQQIDFNRNVIFIRNREVPIAPQAMAALKELECRVIDHKAPVLVSESGESMTVDGMQGVFLSFLRKCGYTHKNLGLSVLRRQFVEGLFKKRLSLLGIARISGIDDVGKLMYYSLVIPITREDMKV